MKKITFFAALLSSVCCLPLLSAMDGVSKHSEVNEDDFRPPTPSLSGLVSAEENSEEEEQILDSINKIALLVAEAENIIANYKRTVNQTAEVERFFKEKGEALECTIGKLGTATNSIGQSSEYADLIGLVNESKALIFDAMKRKNEHDLSDFELSNLAPQRRANVASSTQPLPQATAFMYLRTKIKQIREEIQRIQKTITGKAK